MGTYGPGLCMKASEASTPYIQGSKWSAIASNSLCTGCSTQELLVRVNSITIGAALFEP